MAKEEKKLSFSISSSRPHPPKRPLQPQPPSAVTDEPKPQFLTVFDPSHGPPPDPTLPVIAPIPNTDFRRGAGAKKMKNLLPSPSSSPTHPSETKFVLESNSAADPSSLSYGLTLRSADRDTEVAEGKIEKDLTLRRFREDMKSLPDDRGMDEFDDVPIESFAAAVLAGYGWKEGSGIGRNNKGDSKVKQYDRRAGTEGLGYAPSADNPPMLTKRRGEVGFSVNNNAKPKERTEKRREENTDDESHRKKRREENTDDESHRKKRREENGDDRSHRKRREENGDDGSHRKSREENRDDGSHRKSREENRDNGSHRSSRRDGPVRWLRSHIRVRVVSKDIKKGKLYLKKGEVVDVVGPTTCDLSMDGSGELVQGVDQRMLETALPKRGGSVLVLSGKHKGIYGSLVEKNAEEETGTVRDADNHALINVRLEEIAEYVGDPSYLGY